MRQIIHDISGPQEGVTKDVGITLAKNERRAEGHNAKFADTGKWKAESFFCIVEEFAEGNVDGRGTRATKGESEEGGGLRETKVAVYEVTLLSCDSRESCGKAVYNIIGEVEEGCATVKEELLREVGSGG